ncbi:RNase III domain-containing protein [Heracleum sosnowskyi]|uniref:RNase III domain-containing protein n=1 Tax=Heracleum sosnowskyi TaxID=360622 RepID=A0AAD8H629_9APIA|nr:RNase III domain-containing protein [Heracleum sosnowskyi]
MLLQCQYPMVPLKVSSSLDTTTHQRLPYTPHRTTPKLPKIPVPSPPPITVTTSESDLLVSGPNQGKVRETTCMGYETWLPTPPKVDNPRSIYNAASLAFIGDCIYELYARRHFLFPPLNIEEYNDRVMAVVRCEAQDAMLRKLINDKFLSKEEIDIIRWGKNIGSAAKTRTKKRAGVAVYNRASSFETLIGFLYLTNTKRLEEVMLKLGFLADGPPA